MLGLLTKVGLLIAGIALVIWGITSYLSIDDLKNCGNTPDPANPACAPADVIVAVSGGNTNARTDEAIKLYKNGWAPKIVFSGAALDSSGPSNAQAMRVRAVAAGIPATDIILDNNSLDTSQNALGTLALLNSGDRRIILVTSPYHERRATIEFRRVFGSSSTIVSHPTQTDSWGPLWWTTPSGWLIGLSETIKTLVVSTWR